jgi:flagellar M-ring protein FliF
MEILQKLLLIWQKIGLVQRVLLAAIVLATGLIGALLVYWAQKPDMRMLYQELPPTEAAKITEKIAGKEIAYELRDGGTTIYVPRESVYQLRLDLAKDGLPVAEQNGYKLFDDEKIGISPFVQNVNLKRALQDELAKSIQMIDGVAHARVHIVSPEQKLFVSDEEQTSASVVLKLRPGYRLSGVNIAARGIPRWPPAPAPPRITRNASSRVSFARPKTCSAWSLAPVAPPCRSVP